MTDHTIAALSTVPMPPLSVWQLALDENMTTSVFAP